MSEIVEVQPMNADAARRIKRAVTKAQRAVDLLASASDALNGIRDEGWHNDMIGVAAVLMGFALDIESLAQKLDAV